MAAGWSSTLHWFSGRGHIDNTNPPFPKVKKDTWDVNILLEYFVKLGPNESISNVNLLAGKLIMQLLLTQMCHSSEIVQLCLSCMRLLKGQVQFQLPKPTKTYTPKNASKSGCLQILTVIEFPGNPLLCPLTTLNSYIKCTKYRRGHINNLFVLVTVQEPCKQALQKMS